uniref:Uncharacterized protein n=1 Tax=Tanacetum cinerariifolium TaxID=118510 RepID=A0A6L2P2S2_TANCI|nr:hypothetical protein [Tanacetum cinerariifolium]
MAASTAATSSPPTANTIITIPKGVWFADLTARKGAFGFVANCLKRAFGSVFYGIPKAKRTFVGGRLNQPHPFWWRGRGGEMMGAAVVRWLQWWRWCWLLEMTAMVGVVTVGDAGEWRRVVTSGMVDLIDREKGSILGVRRKSSSEKFSDDGEMTFFLGLQKKQRLMKTKRKVTEVAQPSDPIEPVIDEAVNEEMDDSLERAATAATSLDAEQDGGAKKPWEMLLLRLEELRSLKGEGGQGLMGLKDYTKLDCLQEWNHLKMKVWVKRMHPGEDKGVYCITDENVFETEVDAAQIQVTNATTTPTILIDEVTLAQTLPELKDTNPRPRLKDFYQLAETLQAEEQQELNDEEKAILFIQLFKKRKKFFAAKRVEEKRNKPPTQAQQRKIMCTYLKNIEANKLTDLKNKSFDSIQKMFDRALKRVNTFVDNRTELVEKSSKKAKAKVIKGSSKRVREELEHENAKKQKIDDEKDKLS